MGSRTLGVDAYQLTTLLVHADEGRTDHRLSMAFFFRKMPKNRNYVVFAGLRNVLAHARDMRFDSRDVDALLRHDFLGPALRARPELLRKLRELDGFEGEIDAVPEGTLTYAGPATRTDGRPVDVSGAPLRIYVPLLRVRTDMVRAKLVETPWLGFVNHMSMVASKAARVVTAAAGKPVLEFGTRRTHPDAAVDASYAAYLAGVAGTSNLEAFARHGVPAAGTMDHFAIQASERNDASPVETERGFFAAFARTFPGAATVLVDTYDTERGIRHAVEATGGTLTGVRIDSNVSVATMKRARELLASLGASHVKIFASDGLDETRVRELAPHVDGFGVGENITCSPDAAVGVAAVAKLTVNGYGKLTMKLAEGSGKATLPGELQCHRYPDHDLVALADESVPAGGRALLVPVWRGRDALPIPSLEASRAWVAEQIRDLPDSRKELETVSDPRKLVASDGLVTLIERLKKEALA
ncbi:MAG: hypothetical protein U0169_24180 [Polyangiaceae bacterium]